MADSALEIATIELKIIRIKNQLAEAEQELKIAMIKKEQASAPEPASKKQAVSTLLEEDDRKKYWYAVHTGPEVGIYNQWIEVAGLPVQNYARCETKFEADRILAQLNQQQQISRHRLSFRPNTSYLSNLSSALINVPPPTKEDWIELQNSSKEVSQYNIPIQEMVMTKKYHKVILTEDAPPGYVHKMIEAGLVHTVYLDMSFGQFEFNSSLQKAITEFATRKKLLESKKQMFARFFSSVPDWGKTTAMAPYHYVELGVVGQEFKGPNPQKSIHDIPSDEEIMERRYESFEQILRRLDNINKESKYKVNYKSDRYLVVSRFTKPLGPEYRFIHQWNEKLSEGHINISAQTKEALYQAAYPEIRPSEDTSKGKEVIMEDVGSEKSVGKEERVVFNTAPTEGPTM